MVMTEFGVLICKSDSNKLKRHSIILVVNQLTLFHYGYPKKSIVYIFLFLKIEQNLLHYWGTPKIRDTTLSNHWNVCIQHFASISCKH